MTRTVFMLGGSNLTYPGQGKSTADLVSDELARLEPGQWQVRATPLSMGRRMAAEAEDLVRRQPAEVTILGLSAQPAVYESVLVKLRRRWPRAARGAASIEALLRKIAGPPAVAAEGGRGSVYSVAQAMALALFGGETRMTVDQSLENTRACLHALAGMESVPVLVRLPVGGASATPARRRRYEQRLRRLKAGISEACSDHRIPFVDVGTALQGAGLNAGHGHDSVHLNLETRQFEAHLLAQRVLELADAKHTGRGDAAE